MMTTSKRPSLNLRHYQLFIQFNNYNLNLRFRWCHILQNYLNLLQYYLSYLNNQRHNNILRSTHNKKLAININRPTST